MNKYLLFLFSLFVFSTNSIADCGGTGYEDRFSATCIENKMDCPEGTLYAIQVWGWKPTCIPCDSTESIAFCFYEEARTRCPNRYIKSGGCSDVYSVLSCSDDMTRDFLSTFIDTFFFPFVAEARPGEIVAKDGTIINMHNRTCYNPHIVY